MFPSWYTASFIKSMMVVSDGVKTMASRTRSTFNGHLEVNKEEIRRFFPLLAHTKLSTFFAWIMWQCTNREALKYTLVAKHHLFEEDMESPDFTSILARWMRLTAYHLIQSDAAFGAWLSLHRLLGTYPLLGTYLLINPWCACAARVTVLGLCVCVCLCLLLNIPIFTWLCHKRY